MCTIVFKVGWGEDVYDVGMHVLSFCVVGMCCQGW